MKRGMIKWRPFNALITPQEVKKELLLEKEKLEMPVISTDQEEEINNNIINAYNNKLEVIIKHIHLGLLITEKGIIEKIYPTYLIIQNKRIYFKYILKLNIL